MANEKIEKAVSKKKVPVLIKLADGKDKALALEAIEAMGRVETEETFNYLTGMLRHDDSQVRIAAARGLGLLKSSKSRAFVEHRMAAETDPEAKRAMIEALGKIREVL